MRRLHSATGEQSLLSATRGKPTDTNEDPAQLKTSKIE